MTPTTQAPGPSVDDVAVLIVDDEPDLTEDLALALQDAGFFCMAAESAEEALRIMADAPEIGVVMIDFRLPADDGPYLARRLLETDARRRVVIMTGPTRADAAPDGVFATLEKPFTLSHVTTVLTRARQAAVEGGVARQAVIARDLPAAAAMGQLSLVYQPVFRPDRSALIGFDARLRWNHPVFGPLLPEAFMPIAEEAGVDLGTWAMRAVAEQAAAWRRAFGAAPYVAVSVSARQWREADLPALVAETLRDHDLPGDALVVEVTESAAVAADAMAPLAALRGLGVRVALGDFGAGLSCLSALPNVPADIVTFNRVLLADPKHALFIRGLVAAMHALGLSAHAEGIETEAQLTLARDAGFTAVQGPLLGQPLPADQVRS